MTKILHFVIWQKKNEKNTLWFDKKTTLYFDEKKPVGFSLDVIDRHFFQIFLASKSGNYRHVPHNDWLKIPPLFLWGLRSLMYLLSCFFATEARYFFATEVNFNGARL